MIIAQAFTSAVVDEKISVSLTTGNYLGTGIRQLT